MVNRFCPRPGVSKLMPFRSRLFCRLVMKPYPNGIQVALVADAVYLYLVALDNCILNDGLCTRGSDIANYLYGIEREGVAGNLVVNKDGSRHIGYMLHNIRGNNYAPIARSKAGGTGFEMIGNYKEIVWPGGGSVVPKSEPQCGWDDELCIRQRTTILIGSLVATVVSLGIIAGVGYIFWKRKLTMMRLEREEWRVNKSALTSIAVQKSMHSLKSALSTSKSDSTCSRQDEKRNDSLYSGDKNVANANLSEQSTLMMYDNQKVVLKSVARHYIPVTKEVIIEINAVSNWMTSIWRSQSTLIYTYKGRDLAMIRLLQHPNVNVLIGGFTEPSNNGLVWNYCQRGSLHDVLLDEDIKLDWVFNISFATEISRKMTSLRNIEDIIDQRT
ncbi:atrial natriuretic peptide receptor 1-like [Gigantopelta aegis]|uniref:atrial natriuretic peptide receptor 1-like n=1 Tax=Gigantopelta aegis TaxID=1735272 RepID=UPI001B887728|nr:atrial natriuretic peptide receptor 1-like [Gigantopelta aegis]